MIRDNYAAYEQHACGYILLSLMSLLTLNTMNNYHWAVSIYVYCEWPSCNAFWR